MGALWQMIVVILIWWVANGITSIASKSMMVTHGQASKSAVKTALKPAFKDFRWLELTLLQHLLGAIASVIFLKIVKGKSAAIWPADAPKTIIWIGGVANVVGNMSTNAAYALVSSSVTQVVKSFEPIFTFFLSLLLYKNYADLTIATLLSIVTMSAGACTFVVLDKSFNVWGLLAAISSNMGFATRNIFLKKLAWESPVQKYAVISICSTIVLIPAILLKLVLISTSISLLTHAQESIISAVSHFTYNTASITVLQDITPLTHATLNLSKRVFVIMANLIYFHTPVTANMLLGLLIFFAGLTLYNFRNKRAIKEITWVVVFFSIVVCLGFQAPQFLGSKNNGSGSLSSKDSVSSGSLLSKDSIKCQPTISTAWVFDRSLPPEILENIKSWRNDKICTSVHVHCGTLQCVRAVRELDDPSITSEFLVISSLVKDTPLEEWFVRHPLYKVLTGLEFEDHLQKVVQLGIMWKYGGIYIDPRIRVTGKNLVLTNDTCPNGWVGSREEFDIGCFLKSHPFIEKLSRQFVKDYPRGVDQKSEFHFDFHSVLKSAFAECPNGKCPDSIVLDQSKQDRSFIERHFGTLWYDWRVRHINVVNLGDEVQAVSGMQFMPYVDSLIERDRFSRMKTKESVTVFFNAWWGDPTTEWPPPSNIDPILTSIHINPLAYKLWSKQSSIDYLKQRTPIGTRDLSTIDFLNEHGVAAYFSGCMTLMIKNPSIAKTRTDNIYFVDVDRRNFDQLPKEIRERGIWKSHAPGFRNGLKQFASAFELLETYSTAKVVVTQRIHCALPCAAMGTPVIYFALKSRKPGGWKGKESPRLRGLTQLFHTVGTYFDEAEEWLKNFPWDNPPPNPNAGIMMRMRATFWNVMRENQALRDAAHKFGMIPLQPPPVLQLGQDEKLLIHLVFMASTFKWYHWRTVESIFHHHPSAKVTIHSNTLHQSEFEVLTDAGYSIGVNSYSLADMLKDSPAEELISKVSSISDETNLLRLLVLYKWGGVYMDNDMIVVNPIDKLKNVLTWEDASNHSISGSFMALEKDSRYSRDCLMAFTKHYNDNANGLKLLTDVWKQWMNKGEVVAMKSALFYMFSESDIKTECFSKSSSYDAKMKLLEEEAYAVRLSSSEEISSKLSAGTICKHVLNSFCVLCNNMY